MRVLEKGYFTNKDKKTVHCFYKAIIGDHIGIGIVVTFELDVSHNYKRKDEIIDAFERDVKAIEKHIIETERCEK